MGCGAAWLNFGLAACRQVRQLKVVQVATHDLKYRGAKSAFEWLFTRIVGRVKPRESEIQIEMVKQCWVEVERIERQC